MYPDDLPHVAMSGGVISASDAAPNLDVDTWGLPAGVDEDAAASVSLRLYHSARQAFADGNRREAARWYTLARSASGQYGLCAAREVYGRR